MGAGAGARGLAKRIQFATGYVPALASPACSGAPPITLAFRLAEPPFRATSLADFTGIGYSLCRKKKCSPPAAGGKIGCGPRDLSGHKDISAIRASAAPCVRLLPPALRRSEVGAEQQVKA